MKCIQSWGVFACEHPPAGVLPDQRLAPAHCHQEADERDATQRRSALAAAPSAPEDYAIQDERTGAVILHAFHGSIDGGDAA